MTSAVQLANWLDTVRLSLHVTAAAIWVGGQITVAGLLPTVRGFGGDATKKVARAFGMVSGPAFLVLLATGVWNVLADHNGAGNHAWQVVLGVKYAVVALALAATVLHVRAKSPALKGASAGLGLLASLGAVVLGVLLAG